MNQNCLLYGNTKPLIFSEEKQVPCVAIGEDFCYLGKLYNFEINASNGAKEFITNKLKALLMVTNKLKVRPQTKLKILKLYIHSQLVFYLKVYDLPSISALPKVLPASNNLPAAS